MAISKWNTPQLSCAAQVYEQYLKKLRSAHVLLDNVEYFIIWHVSGPLSTGLKEFHCNNLSSNYGLAALNCCIYRLRV